jgi:hypothetical protein
MISSAQCTLSSLVRLFCLTVTVFFITYDRLSVFLRRLANNDAGRHGVAGRYARHDRSIVNTQVLDSIDLELAVYHRHGITSHLGGARLMSLMLDWLGTSRHVGGLCGRHVLPPACVTQMLLLFSTSGGAVTAISMRWSLWKGRRSGTSSNAANDLSQRSLWKLRARSRQVWSRSMNRALCTGTCWKEEKV